MTTLVQPLMSLFISVLILRKVVSSCRIFTPHSLLHTSPLPHISTPSNMSSSTPTSTGRSYYDGDVDFDVLAAKDPDFAALCKVAKDKRWVDFQNPKVVQYVCFHRPWPLTIADTNTDS